MEKFVTAKKPVSLRTPSTAKSTSRFHPYDKGYEQRPSSSAITKHLLSTLSDEKNPITHDTSGKRVDHVESIATGHQRAEPRVKNVKSSRKDYFEQRGKKLERQAAVATGSDSSQKRVLQNVRVYINGYLNDTTDIEMKRIVSLAGGAVLQTPSGATHILTSQGLNGSKTHKHLTAKSRNIVHVVKPEWVTESIKAGKRLSERNFAVIKDNTMQSLDEMFASSRS